MTTSLALPRSYNQGLELVQGRPAGRKAGLVRIHAGTTSPCIVISSGQIEVVVFWSDGTIRLDSGGSRTVSIKNLINSCLPMDRVTGWRLVQVDFNWVLQNFDRLNNKILNSIPFHDKIFMTPKEKSNARSN